MTEHKYITINPVPLSLAGLLGVLFVYLKLTETINWPWIWVLCPFWIGPAGLLLALMLALLLILFVMACISLYSFFGGKL
jgi:hypothetical protein